MNTTSKKKSYDPLNKHTWTGRKAQRSDLRPQARRAPVLLHAEKTSIREKLCKYWKYRYTTGLLVDLIKNMYRCHLQNRIKIRGCIHGLLLHKCIFFFIMTFCSLSKFYQSIFDNTRVREKKKIFRLFIYVDLLFCHGKASRRLSKLLTRAFL